jgi:uncharacterized protein YbjQ (UPF0145 family)
VLWGVIAIGLKNQNHLNRPEGIAMKTIRQIGSIAFVAGLFTVIFIGLSWYAVVADNPVLPWWFRAAIFCLLGGILVVLVSLALEQRVWRAAAEPSLADEEVAPSMLLLTADAPSGRPVGETLGLVQGHTVFAVWLGKDLSALVRLVLGGELTEYTEMMGRARAKATARMVNQALAMGADAVVNVRYMTTSVVGSAAELLVYGTAVKLG